MNMLIERFILPSTTSVLTWFSDMQNNCNVSDRSAPSALCHGSVAHCDFFWRMFVETFDDQRRADLSTPIVFLYFFYASDKFGWMLASEQKVKPSAKLYMFIV